MASSPERYGRIEVQGRGARRPSRSRAKPAKAAECCYRWHPPHDVAHDLPAGFFFDFQVKAPDGLRRFVPPFGDQMLHNGYLAGVALLKRDKSLGEDQRWAYRLMSLICQRMQTMREHQRRRFGSIADLCVKKTGRGAGIESSVLPDDLGKRADGTGRKWSPTELIAKGRARACQAGHTETSEEYAIAYGLFAAAERNPLPCDDSNVPGLIRRALFDLSQATTTVDGVLLDRLADRVARAIGAHLGDSQEAFDSWFSGPKSNVIKSLANQRDRWGKLTMEQARAGFLEVGWRSYQYMADALSYFSQCFLAAIPCRLNRREKSLFEQMYLRQPHFGGLTLCLMLERAKLLAPALASLWDDPLSTERRYTLYRVLHYYAEMSASRHEADRRFKRLRSSTGSAKRELTNVDEAVSLRRASTSNTEDLYEYLTAALKHRGKWCSRCRDACKLEHETPGKGANAIRVKYWCPCHPKRRVARISFAEIRALDRE